MVIYLWSGFVGRFLYMIVVDDILFCSEVFFGFFCEFQVLIVYMKKDLYVFII